MTYPRASSASHFARHHHLDAAQSCGYCRLAPAVEQGVTWSPRYPRAGRWPKRSLPWKSLSASDKRGERYSCPLPSNPRYRIPMPTWLYLLFADLGGIGMGESLIGPGLGPPTLFVT